MKIYNTTSMLPATTVLNASFNGPARQLENMFGYSIQVVFTGTPNGTFKLQASADPVTAAGQVFGANGAVTYTPTNWSDVSLSPVIVSAAGNYMWNVIDTMYNYVRLVYTDASGGVSTAVLTVSTFNGKGF
jgi:hypothetical protein